MEARGAAAYEEAARRGGKKRGGCDRGAGNTDNSGGGTDCGDTSGRDGGCDLSGPQQQEAAAGSTRSPQLRSSRRSPCTRTAPAGLYARRSSAVANKGLSEKWVQVSPQQRYLGLQLIPRRLWDLECRRDSVALWRRLQRRPLPFRWTVAHLKGPIAI